MNRTENQLVTRTFVGEDGTEESALEEMVNGAGRCTQSLTRRNISGCDQADQLIKYLLDGWQRWPQTSTPKTAQAELDKGPENRPHTTHIHTPCSTGVLRYYGTSRSTVRAEQECAGTTMGR